MGHLFQHCICLTQKYLLNKLELENDVFLMCQLISSPMSSGQGSHYHRSRFLKQCTVINFQTFQSHFTCKLFNGAKNCHKNLKDKGMDSIHNIQPNLKRFWFKRSYQLSSNNPKKPVFGSTCPLAGDKKETHCPLTWIIITYIWWFAFPSKSW